jgi:hypothetical protein
MSNIATSFDKPTKVSGLDLAFGGKVNELMPPYSEIPDEFKRSSGVWPNWQSDWFYSGLKRYPEPKEGINVHEAMRHLGAIQGSFAPKHEHKQAGVAYLASLWFKSPNGEPLKAA